MEKLSSLYMKFIDAADDDGDEVRIILLMNDVDDFLPSSVAFIPSPFVLQSVNPSPWNTKYSISLEFPAFYE